MISVNLPDGSVAQFPDDTPPEKMKAAIQKKFPPKKAAVAQDQAQPSTPQPTGYDAGLPAQGISGAYEGIADVLGAPADLVNLGLRGGAAALHAAGGPDVQFPVEPLGGSQSIAHAMGGLIKPETNDPTNQFVRGTVRNMTAAVVPVGGEIAQSAKPTRALGAALGTGAASAIGGEVAQQAFPDNPYANALGMIAGGGAAVGVTKLARKIASPNYIDPARAAANATMASNGIDLTAGQQTGNQTLQYAESELGGAAAHQAIDTQRKQFTQAVLAKAGISGDLADPPTMRKAFDDIGQQFEDLGARNAIQADPKIAQDMQNVWQKYDQNTNPNTRSPLIENTLKGIATKAFGGGFNSLPGSFYNEQISNLNTEIQHASGQELRALQATKSLLDDAMERSMQAANSPDLGAFQQARRDYKNLLVIKDAAANSPTGILTPAQIKAAAVSQNKKAYVTGRNDFSDLVHAGQTTMTPLPQSGTTPRAVVHGVLPALGTAAGMMHGGLDMAALGGLLGAAANKAAGGLLLSPAGKAYLTNQRFAGPMNGSRALVGPAVGSVSSMTSALGTQGGPESIPQISVHGALPAQ